MNPYRLHSQLQEALEISIAWGRAKGLSNADRSGFFAAEVGQRLMPLVPQDCKLLQIGFNKNDGKFQAGEWMLDGAIVDAGDDRLVRRIHVAMECESSTAMKEFTWDFGKLLNVRARTKIFLHGLNQASSTAADGLVEARLALAAAWIREHDFESTWFLAFWPSPEKTGEFPSLWDAFGTSTRFDHLSRIRLFGFDGKSFVAAGATDMPVAARPERQGVTP